MLPLFVSRMRNKNGRSIRVEQPILGAAANAFEPDEVLKIDRQLPTRGVPVVSGKLSPHQAASRQ
jgi:hypothetical protein